MIKFEKVEVYKTDSGREPLMEWVNSLGEPTQSRMKEKMSRVMSGCLGDWKSLGRGIYELRVHFGAGYRMYFALEENKLILLLCGGNKSRQKKDIAKAKKYLTEYQGRSI